MEHENLSVAEQLKVQHEIENIKQCIVSLEDSLQSWMDCYLDLLIRPIRDEQIIAKFTLHLVYLFVLQYRHYAIFFCLKLDVVA